MLYSDPEMSDSIYSLEFLEFVFPLVPNAVFHLDDFTISISQILYPINETFFDNMPNLHKHIIEEKYIDKYLSRWMIITDNNHNKLIIKNINVEIYLKKYCSNIFFRQAFKKTFSQIVSHYTDSFLEDINNMVEIDFVDFLYSMSKNLEMYFKDSPKNSMNIYHSHLSYVNMRANLFESADCMNHIFSYIDFPSLCKMRLVCARFAYIIEGYTLSPFSIDIMNDIKTEFSYGCFYDAKSNNIIDKYKNYINSLNKYIGTKTNEKLMKYVDEYILLKCLIKFGHTVTNKLIKYFHIEYLSHNKNENDIEDENNNEDDDESSKFNFKLKLVFTEDEFMEKKFNDIPIIMYFLKNKTIYDLYSLINMKCVRFSKYFIKKIGHYILTKYGHVVFLELYMKNNWRCFPDLNYQVYPFYQQIVNYLNAMISRNITIPYSVKKYFLDIVKVDDINNCSESAIKDFMEKAFLSDNAFIFSTILETKKIKKSRKAYIKYVKNSKIACPEIFKHLKNSKNF